MSWELYSIAVTAVMALVAGAFGLRVFRDESALRRKHLPAGKP